MGKENVGVNELTFFNEILYEWTVEPFVSNSDILRPGQSMTDLNRILS